MIVKSSRFTDFAGQQASDFTCWSGANTCEPFMGLPVRAEICECSSSRFSQYLFVHPMYLRLHPEQVNLYITPDMRDLGSLSLKVKQDESFVLVLKITLRLENGTIFRKLRMRLFFTFQEVVPRNGTTITNSFLGTVWTGSLFSYSLLKNRKMHLSTISFSGSQSRHEENEKKSLSSMLGTGVWISSPSCKSLAKTI